MSGAAATSWAQPASDSNDIASHMSNLSVDDYGSPHRQNASPGAPPPPGGPYANVHTPPRPAAAFNPYDPFIYYAGVDPSTFTPNGAGAPQGYPYADVTTPLQAMATGANVYGDPYPSPPETYGSHTPDARSPGQVPAALTAFQHQLAAATAGARSQQVYRPPHTGQQLQVPHQLPTPPQQGYYNYIERGVYWHPRQNSVSSRGGRGGKANPAQRHRAMPSGTEPLYAGWRLRLTRPTGSSHRLTLRRPAQAQRRRARTAGAEPLLCRAAATPCPAYITQALI